jgi:hypothetical protein
MHMVVSDIPLWTQLLVLAPPSERIPFILFRATPRQVTVCGDSFTADSATLFRI